MDILKSNSCLIKHRPLKRLFDIVLSLLALTFGMPIFSLIAILVMITSPGSPVYAQRRVGRGGKLFWCYKFRTMYGGADQLLKNMLETNPQFKSEWESSFKLKNDPRITPFGHFLRKTSLDELPQLWNVLKGDLSIVGPRPVIEQEIVEYYKDKSGKILSVRPGLTGLWQISGRSDIKDYQTRINLDERYVDNQSFWLDLKVIVKTVPAVFLSKGAY